MLGGLWERVPSAGQHTICLVALVAVSLAFFAPIHFGGRSLVPSDTVNWRASAQSIIEYESETGDYALWATNVFGGMPAFMIRYPLAVPQVDSILRSVRRVLWPSSHLITLFAGMYLLVFYLSRNKFAGVVAALLFGLTTYIPVILSAGHNSKFIALSLAPWLLLAFAHALRKPGFLASLLFAVALSVNLRAGHFQITYYVLFSAAVWWITEGVTAVRENRLAVYWKSTAVLVLGGMLAGLMVAQPYLAQFEYKAYTIRGSGPGGTAGGMAWDYAMGWSQGVAELVTLVIAEAFGGSEAYWGPKNFTAGPHYLTGIGALLAIVGGLRSRTVAARGLGVAGVFMVLFALGDHFALLNRPMFEYFPLFDSFRVPETWLAAVALVAAVLAGLGLESLVRSTPERPLVRTPVAIGFMVFVAAVFILLVARETIFDFEKPGEEAVITQQIARSNQVPANDPRVTQAAERVLGQLKEERRDRFGDDAIRTLLFLVLAGGGFLLFYHNRLSAHGLQAMVALMVLVDLWGVDRRYLNEDSMQRSSDLERAIPEYAFDRFILDQTSESDRFRVLSLEGAPTQTPRPSYYHESLSGYHGAKLRVYQDFLDHLLVTPEGRLNTEALRMLNTRYVVSRSPIQGTTHVFSDAQTGFNVYEVDEALPRTFFVDSTVVVSTAEETWERVNSPTFDPSTTAYLEKDLRLSRTAGDSPEHASATISPYSPRRIEIEATTDAERLLVLSEVYYPAGWRATIDGISADILRVDYLLRGVVVPPGTHEIHFVFEPAGHRIGIWLAGISTALVYGALLFLLISRWRRARSRRSGDVEESVER